MLRKIQSDILIVVFYSIYRTEIGFKRWRVFLVTRKNEKRSYKCQSTNKRKLIRFSISSDRLCFYSAFLFLTALISFARQLYRRKKKPIIIYAFNNDALKVKSINSPCNILFACYLASTHRKHFLYESYLPMHLIFFTKTKQLIVLSDQHWFQIYFFNFLFRFILCVWIYVV